MRDIICMATLQCDSAARCCLTEIPLKGLFEYCFIHRTLGAGAAVLVQWPVRTLCIPTLDPL